MPGGAVEETAICYRSDYTDYREINSNFQELLEIVSEITILRSPSHKPSSHVPANSFPQTCTKCWSALTGNDWRPKQEKWERSPVGHTGPS